MRNLLVAILTLTFLLSPVFALCEPAGEYTIKEDGDSLVIEGTGDAAFDLTLPDGPMRLYAASAQQLGVDFAHESGETVHFGVPFPRNELLPLSGTYRVTLSHVGEPIDAQTWYIMVMPLYDDDSLEFSGSTPIMGNKFEVTETTEVTVTAKSGLMFHEHGFVEIHLYAFDEDEKLTDKQMVLSEELHDADAEVSTTVTLEPGAYAWLAIVDGEVEYSVGLK